MRLNLSDAVDDLAPIDPPPCFYNRESWKLYLKSAAASQNHRSNQKVILVDEAGNPRFNERLNYCADCTQAKSMEMLALGRCDPFHLSDQPDPPDTSDAPTVRPGGQVIRPGCEQMFSEQPQGDAFERLVAFLLLAGETPMAWSVWDGA